MRKLIIAGAFAAAVFAASCDTLNIGGGLPFWGPTVTIGAGPNDTANFSGENFTWTANWSGGTAPYTVAWNFGANFNPTTANANTAGTSDSQTVLMNNAAGATGTVSITVTDAQNLPGTDTADFGFGPQQNAAPVLSVTGGDGSTAITVHGEDADGDDITVTPTAPVGFTVGGAQTISGGSGDVTFNFSASDILNGGTGTATFDGTDGTSAGNQVSATVTAAPIPLVADTLYAIPLQSTAGAADTVTIVVATGVPANPFQFNNGTRVTAPTGFAYVSNSFNIGVTGGDAGATDGFWTGMAPAGGFLLAPDNFITETDLGGGLIGISFNCTPIGGSDQNAASGVLFNFGANFGAGANTLGFAQADGPIKRTYYSDGAATEYFWGDISNNYAGVPNSVTVN